MRRASSAIAFPCYGQLVNGDYETDRTGSCRKNERRASGSSPKTGAGKKLARIHTVADFFRRRRATTSNCNELYKPSSSPQSGDHDADTHASCPSLLVGVPTMTPVEIVKSRVAVTRSCDGGDARMTRSRRDDDSSGLVASTLTVPPNIFVTSLSRSVDVLTASHGVTTPRRRSVVVTRGSAPELTKPDAYVHQDCFFATVSPPPSPHPSSPVLVHDNLYMATTNCAYNERLLCKLNIASVVELDVGAVHSVPRPYSPCLCERRERHRPAALRLSFSQPPDGAALRSCFDQVNRFIDGARGASNNVLVCGDHQLHYVIVIQYLTARCDVRRAYSLVMRQCPGLNLSPVYQRLLVDVANRAGENNTARPGAMLAKDAW